MSALAERHAARARCQFGLSRSAWTGALAGTCTTTFLAIAKVPYPLPLGIFVAIVDLLPVMCRY